MLPSQLDTPPVHCEYAGGPCDQVFDRATSSSDALFLFGSKPEPIASAIRSAIEEGQRTGVGARWRSWEGLPIEGQIIFCQICKAMRFAATVVADVTTLNFNLLFEIGFAIGLGVPLIPIRDTTYVVDQRQFEELEVLTTLGYLDFSNGHDLLTALTARLPGVPLSLTREEVSPESPLYVLRGPVDTEGTIRLLSAIKKSRVKFRTYDPRESTRLSLAEVRRQVDRSVGLVAYLLSPHRENSTVHNGLCAFVSGMAMARGKIVTVLQEEEAKQPIDYRDVVQTIQSPAQIPGLLEGPLARILDTIQTRRSPGRPLPSNLLQRLDLGDTAAENEISGLDDYFVETGQYLQARQGHARLVVGRKGSGKTAIFYALRNPLIGTPSRLVMDLRPEGFQFIKLRELVLDQLGLGLQEHTMAAFWHFLLLTELAHKILVADRPFAERDPQRAARFREVERIYKSLNPNFEADFSQRLLLEVDRVAERFGQLEDGVGPDLTEKIFTGDTPVLEDAVVTYLAEKEETWLLIDNLDKSWPTHGSNDADILIVRSLLEAARKLQRRMEDRGVEFRCLVFLRTDIYEHLLRTTPDKGKDTAIALDWEDAAMFEEVLLRRVESSTELHGDFREVWPELSDSLVGVQDTFDYLVDRTLMRPRDLLMFMRRCIDVAINRGHPKIEVEDILTAEASYSEDMLLWMAYEIGDTHPKWQNVLYAFQGSRPTLSPADVAGILLAADVDGADIGTVQELLLRFGFLGVSAPGFPEPKFSHTVHFNMHRLLDPLDRGEGMLVIHPAFLAALGI